MSDTKVVRFDREEFAELLDIESDKDIERVTVAFSPMMQEWSLIVDFFDEVQEPPKHD